MKNLKISLAETLKGLVAFKQGAKVESLYRKKVKGISTDTRDFKAGEIFVAIAGERFDGHDYVPEAVKKGALAVIVHKDINGPEADFAIKVDDTLKALGDLANYIRSKYCLKVVAITGSNGKTSTKELLSAIMNLAGPTLATEGNFNNLVGLPLSIFKLDPHMRQAVLEMGMNRFGEISRLTEIADPDVGVITSVGEAHLEFFGSLAEVAKAKGELFAGLRKDAIAVVNNDEPLIKKQAKKFHGVKLSFGSTAACDIWLDKWRSNGMNGQSFMLYGPDAAKGIKIKLQLLGRHNAANALAAAAAAFASGLDWSLIEHGLSSVPAFPGRLAAIKSNKGLWVLDDSYNANPTSTSAGLRLLSSLRKSKPVGAILGDMLELGTSSITSHRQMGTLAAQLNLDFLSLVGPYSLETAKAAKRSGMDKKKVMHFDSPQLAAQWVAENNARGSIVLIKGSRSMHMEQAVSALVDSSKMLSN